jgi:nuclear cap-binding protein subunit 1
VTLPSDHPKRVFIARVLELEVRVSYYDRVKKTLPDAYLDAPGLFPTEAPGPSFAFDEEGGPCRSANVLTSC